MIRFSNNSPICFLTPSQAVRKSILLIINRVIIYRKYPMLGIITLVAGDSSPSS